MMRKTLLIVDDDKTSRAVLAGPFVSEYEIAYAQNGVEATTYLLASGEAVCLIFLDIMMPEMDGIAFLKWLSASRYCHTPVIAVTADSNAQREALQNGAWDFVVKPASPDVLRMRVNNVLGRSDYLREKEASDALRAVNGTLGEAQRQMAHLVNSIPGGIAIYRMAQGRFETLYYSEGVAELSGYTREEYEKTVGRNAADMIYPPDRRRLMSNAVKLLQEGKTFDETCRIGHKNGSFLWVRLSGMPMQQTPEGLIVHAVLQGVSPQTRLYQSMLDETQTAVYACDVSTHEILYFNRKMAELTGAALETTDGKKCYEHFFKRTSPCEFCRIGALRKGEIWEREFVHSTTQNTYEMKGTLIDWNGITAHVEYIQDITEKKKAEAERAALLGQLASIMDHVPGALCLYRATESGLQPVIHNKSFYKVFGYSEEHEQDIDQKTSFLNVHPADLERLREKTAAALKTSSLLEDTYRVFNDQKQCYIWLNLRAAVVDQPDGSKLCYASYADVTEERLRQEQQQKAQETLRELQTQAQRALGEYQTLVNTTPGAIVVYEVVGQRVETKYYSDGLCRITGYSRAERDAYSRADALELIDGRDAAAVREALQQAIRTKSNLDLTYRIRCKNAASRYIRLNATYVLNERGRPEFHAVFSDVDEMKRLEAENESQRIRYGVAIKSAGINVWEYDIQNDLLTVVSNSSRIQQNCYSISNYIQSTVDHGYVRKDSLPAFYSIFKRLKAGEKEVVEDIWYKTTDEAGWWCERVIYTAVFDEAGVPVRAFGAGRDVTREKEAIRKFQEEMNYRAAIQGSSVGSVKINLTQNKILEGASPFPSVMKWIQNGDADQYFFNNAQCLTDGKDREVYCKKFNRRAFILQFQRGEYNASLKVTRRVDSTRVHWLQYHVHLMKNPENSDVVAFLAAHDITDEQVRRMIMDTVSKTDFERIIVVDGLNNCAADYSVNREKRYFRLGQNFEESFERLIHENVAPEDVERVAKSCRIDHVLAKIQNGNVYKINYSIVHPDKTLCRKQLQFTLMHREQKTFLMTRIDVNEVFVQQEAAKEQLRSALHTAQKAANAKTEFLSRMSHDMRTPMNGIIGLTGLSKDIPNLPREMRDNLAAIEDSGKYLLGLINDTLDMSKIESNKITFHYEVVCAENLIKNILGYVAPMLNAKHIALEWVPIHAQLEYIRIDRMRVEQIFINILSNAIKFTPDGGKIRLEIECCRRENGIAHDRISIEDTGIGMSQDFISKAFEPFTQENTDITTNYAGTGLGLSIVKNLVELMGGTIEVESQLGRGTKVTVYLDFERVYDGQTMEAAPASAELDILNGRHILLCEDHPLNAQIATKLLETRGMSVVRAENGRIAVDLFAAAAPGTFDAVLMDIRMPVMDGLEATRQIRQLPRADAKTTPIIAMTANAFDTDRENSRAAGMTAHLAKPIEPELLYETLARYIGSSANQ